ncbi:F-box domain containing protein [Pandoravirus macleodensis]|uniref:F-box domain containing protein n=1 Tax=Pandoravirus macleodensis TaxID=2107707 RepID=A0A2U7UFS6_9VIRU|nr:F-box domain containing protein [Pandoravirus macleodensis]AVK77327.1 F-box domain containing protein [Pandoravirus macleodensis]
MDCFADEILLAVAAWLDARGLCALQATSTRFNRIARDPHLWRRLFACDFAVLFHAPLQWSPYAPLVDDGWPPEARLLYERAGRCVQMPSPSPSDAGLPPPLARAFAMGKNWPWVYRACAAAFRQKRGRCILVGAVCSFQGYGASIKLSKTETRVMQWTEHAPGWNVRHAAESFKCAVGLFSHTRVANGARLWEACGTECAATLPGLEGAVRITIQTTDQGGHIVTAHWPLPRRAAVRTCYVNGDVQVTLGVSNCAGIEFVCSPRCPDARFAGRAFSGPWTVLHDPDVVFDAGLLLPAPSNQDASAFWYYVLSGLVGWTDAERRRALKYAGLPCPSREVALAVANTLSAVGGPLHFTSPLDRAEK